MDNPKIQRLSLRAQILTMQRLASKSCANCFCNIVLASDGLFMADLLNLSFVRAVDARITVRSSYSQLKLVMILIRTKILAVACKNSAPPLSYPHHQE